MSIGPHIVRHVTLVTQQYQLGHTSEGRNTTTTLWCRWEKHFTLRVTWKGQVAGFKIWWLWNMHILRLLRMKGITWWTDYFAIMRILTHSLRHCLIQNSKPFKTKMSSAGNPKGWDHSEWRLWRGQNGLLSMEVLTVCYTCLSLGTLHFIWVDFRGIEQIQT